MTFRRRYLRSRWCDISYAFNGTTTTLTIVPIGAAPALIEINFSA
jgi:hypothetical protein